MKNRSPESGSVSGRIDDFERIKGQITPEVLEAMMNGYSDDQFWADECLIDSAENDRTFGVKIWTAFSEILEYAGIKNSEQPEDRDLVQEFDFLSQLLMRADLPISSELRVAAVRKVKQNFIEKGFPENALNGANLMKLAYIGEAEAMERCGLDWKKQSPFTFALRTNPQHPMVKKVLTEENERKSSLLSAAIENDPDLAKLFEKFYKNKKPLVQ